MSSWTTSIVRSAIAILGSLAVATPAIAQSADSRSERAMFLMRNEAALLLNTVPGRLEFGRFGSMREDGRVTGYEGVLQVRGGDESLTCRMELDERVRCGAIDAPTTNLCDSAAPQETVWTKQFAQSLFSNVYDYTVRIYRVVDPATDARQLCMNVYNERERTRVGVIPVRESSTAAAYYGDRPLNNRDHQIILAPDNTYIYRQSEGSTLRYEGYSR